MLLKDSPSEPDWLSEPHSLSEAASSLSECKTLEDSQPESSAISAQPARPAWTLSLLALSMSKLA
ncbi:hypothetical protein JHK87_051048 [Glycine soja]|nr:hypothetical protein JHK87_051048 [Glycine soja]